MKATSQKPTKRVAPQSDSKDSLIERVRAHVPAELLDLPIWLLWSGNPKDKQPFYANGEPRSGKLDTTQDRAKLMTFEDAVKGFSGRLRGVGVALGAVPGTDIVISGIDLDHCYDNDGQLSENAQQVMLAACSYTERGPSGDGLHILGYGAIGTDASQKKRGLEIYDAGRYLTVTGERSNDAQLVDISDAAALARKLWGVPESAEDLVCLTEVAADDDRHRQHEGGRNTYLSNEAFRLRKQGVDIETIVDVLLTFNKRVCDPPLPESEVRKIAEGKARIGPNLKPFTIEDFYAYSRQDRYVCVPTGETWPGKSVNARLGRVGARSAATHLAQNRAIDQMTWHPGEPQIIEDRLVVDGGFIEHRDARVFNQYRAPRPIEHGDAGRATRWLDHVRLVYPDEAEHIIAWLAHRVQRPGDKVNHALVLGGAQGVGKDTLLQPAKVAVGPWNFAEVTPTQIQGRFNGFLKSAILRVSETRDLGENNRYGFYEHMKAIIAAPPDTHRIDEKHLHEYYIFNVTGVILTTNNKINGIYIPPDDRRHFVAWSEKTKDDFTPAYWNDLWGWYTQEGFAHVAAYLATHDLSGFDAKAPPRKTQAWWEIVNANRAPEDAELADAVEALGSPDALTVPQLIVKAEDKLSSWLEDQRNARHVPHRLESAGYVAVHCDLNKQGYWRVNGRRLAVYAKHELSVQQRVAAARALAEGVERSPPQSQRTDTGWSWPPRRKE